MTRHIFKLVWNRKRSAALILVEILICFLVLCGLFASFTSLASRWGKPLGFAYENIWVAEIGGMSWRAEGEELAANRRAVADLIRAVKSMPEVESAAVSTNTPYSGSTWADGTYIDGREVHYLWTLGSSELPDVLGLELLHGRWLDETDGALHYQPVVLSQAFARDLFGTSNPVGQDMPLFDRDGQPTELKDDAKINRVVGVMADYRRSGEFHDAQYTTLVAVDLTGGDNLPAELLIRVQPGTTAAFEERLVRTLQNVAPQWSYDTTLLESRRHSWLLEHIGPGIIAAVITLFLIVMVGLGLVGVLWLSVTRRTAELGLRRAMGASDRSVRGQILGELWALTSIAVVAGSVIVLQFPLFGANFGLDWSVFLAGLTMAALVIYGFVTICGLYPTWLATRIQPATALQYE